MHFNGSHFSWILFAQNRSESECHVYLRQASAAQPAPIKPGLGVQLVTAGTAACVADLFTFPLDTAKVRLQVQGK